ncbi:hypothetical protein [Akkermansia sp. NBRC 115031]|uniref:hypothetical protein n=1 Tax=Akkermansia sp. NBRC 115031 TaxID=2994522 RepID=UPI0025537576|nr:hypothetical protein [Akkermansia sp. NBRC 115031]
MIVIKSHQEENASRKKYSSRITLYNEEDRDRVVRIAFGKGGVISRNGEKKEISILHPLHVLSQSFQTHLANCRKTRGCLTSLRFKKYFYF